MAYKIVKTKKIKINNIQYFMTSLKDSVFEINDDEKYEINIIHFEEFKSFF